MMGLHWKLVLTFIISFNFIPYVLSSEGDRSPFYRNCVKSCMKSNCTDEGRSYTKKAAEYYEYEMFVWNCLDECRYICMWRTVEGFKERGFQIPKFHGKWPFKRIWGMQEPASVFASFLNLAAHVYMHVEIIHVFPVDNHILVLFWHVFAAVCMNAWVWSMIFHVKDNPYTEFMDYACALSMVVMFFLAAVIRVLQKHKKPACVILLATFLYFIEHVRYLYSDNVNYDYNMIVNVFFGTAGSLIWLVWSVRQYLDGRRYAWRVGAFALLSGAALSLELLDFPPKFGGWDAHALWHLSTAPLALLFYRFVIDDLLYLHGMKRD